MRRFPSLLPVLLFVFFVLACGPDGTTTASPAGRAEPAKTTGTQTETPTARDVVLISVDTLRHDYLGYAGHDVATPNLDRLAARGRVYSEARAHAVMTTPSHLSMLTGTYPHRHGVRDNGGFRLADDVRTLAELLGEAGFATAGFVSAYPLSADKGLARGFDLYDDVTVDLQRSDELILGLPDPRAGVGQRPGREAVAAARDWWLAGSDKRRFLFVHVYEPHAPYDPPPRHDRWGDPYTGEIAWTDEMLAPLLEAVETDDPLVIFTSDHGEALGAHGEPTHGFFAYEPSLRVPLVIAGPGVEPGVDLRPARHVDLLPTVAEAVSLRSRGVELPAGLPGRSLLRPAAQDPEEQDPEERAREDIREDEEQVTYFESLSPYFNMGWAPLRGILRGRYKAIDQPIPELYDLAADPGESRNLADEKDELLRELLAHLPEEEAFGGSARDLDAEETAQLAALGYVATETAERDAAFGPDDDLKRMIGPYTRLRELVAWLHDGRLDDVVREGRDLLPRLPDSRLLHQTLSLALIRRGDAAEGVEVIRRAIEHGAASPQLRRQLGISLMSLGRLEEAIQVLEETVALDPDAATLNVLGHARLRSGDARGAVAAFERAVELFPGSPEALENLSFVYLQAGRPAEAEAYARRALDLDDDLDGAWNNLGLALYGQERPEEAVDAWQRAAELGPDDADIVFNLGLVASEIGRREAAQASLERFLELVAADPEAFRGDPRVAEARRVVRSLD